MSQEDARTALVMAAGRMVGGHLYLWGGESTAEGGFDCSGFASHVLTEVSRMYPELYDGVRRTAAGLDRYFMAGPKITQVEDLRPGTLTFFADASGGRVYHVKIHLATLPPIAGEHPFRPGKKAMLEVGPIAADAGGGNSKSISPRASLGRAAGIRLSASDRHGASGIWWGRDPFVGHE